MIETNDIEMRDDFFDVPEMKILDRMQDGETYILIYIYLFRESKANKGILMLTNNEPHTIKTLAELFNRDIDIVGNALVEFQKLALIDVLENGAIYIKPQEWIR